MIINTYHVPVDKIPLCLGWGEKIGEEEEEKKSKKKKWAEKHGNIPVKDLHPPLGVLYSKLFIFGPRVFKLTHSI